MAIHIKRPSDIKPSDITPKSVYLDRRKFMKHTLATSVLLATDAMLPAWAKMWPDLAESKYSTKDTPNTFEDITTYNNFYEFGTSKSDPAQNAGSLVTSPWSVAIEGEVEKPVTYHFEDLVRSSKLEERIYRHRCVEAWSMVIPWNGFSLRNLIARFRPTSRAKYVEFTTLLRPSEMPGQRGDVLPWPYVEGLRMDEAMHPLTMVVTGLYGRPLPNQVA